MPMTGTAPVLRLPPGCTERVVRFSNLKQQQLVGSLVECSTSSKVAVLCHGFASGRQRFHFPAMAVALASKQVGSLRFDFHGNGDSQGTFEYGNYRDEMLDIRAAVEQLAALGKEVVALVGHSKGGNAVLLYAASYDDVPMVVNIAGRFDMRHGITDRFGTDIFDRLARDKTVEMETPTEGGTRHWKLSKWSMDERLALDMQAVCRSISAEVLTIHGSKDETIPFADGQAISGAVECRELFRVEGACHRFKKPEHAQAMIDKCVRFITM